MEKHIWEIELFVNVGTLENPIMDWQKSRRIYNKEKHIDDFDLFPIEGKRRNATFIGTRFDIEKNELQ